MCEPSGMKTVGLLNVDSMHKEYILSLSTETTISCQLRLGAGLLQESWH